LPQIASNCPEDKEYAMSAIRFKKAVKAIEARNDGASTAEPS
jgi:hypothetical protein